jgi:4-hydroxy-tetrahydrodipicolinate synthase
VSEGRLRGVVAAIPTPIDERFEPDRGRFLALATRLLADGCDGLNVLGTTGEATSFSTPQRLSLMEAVARSPLPLGSLMVGTGAAATADAVALTAAAAELGFAGALVLPPFYYKGVPDEGVVRYVERLVGATKDRPIPIYLYNFPALSGVPFTPPLVQRLAAEFGARIRGVKDSSGDMAYARALAAALPALDVFPSTEACLLDARDGAFAGCISATANIDAPYCARAFRDGDATALRTAVALRGLFEGKPLVPGVKALLAALADDPALAAVLPPLVPWPADARRALLADYTALTASP